MANYPTTNFFEQPFNYQNFPKEGPVMIPLTAIDFSVASIFNIDLTQIQQFHRVTTVQSIYCDNSANTSSVSFRIGKSNQLVTIPPGAQAYIPLLAPNPTSLTVSSASVSATPGIFLLNIPVQPIVWFPAGAPGGTQAVSDAILDATVSGGRVQTLPGVVGSTGTVYPEAVGNAVVTGAIASSTGTLVTGSPGYYVTGFSFQPSTAVAASAGTVTVALTDSSFGTIFQGSLPIGTVIDATEFQIASPGNLFWNNKIAASTLSITLGGTAITSGTIQYNIWYGLASFVG